VLGHGEAGYRGLCLPFDAVRRLVSSACCVLLAAPAAALAADAPTTTDAAVYPELRAVAELSLPGHPREGGYPALRAPDALPFPSEAAIAAARAYVASRDAEVSFAVADESGGVRGLQQSRKFASASLTKAMILVAELDRLAEEDEELATGELASLGYMIRLSDNGSAEDIYRRVGDDRLRALADRAGMRDFEISGDWANATLTAADQARFFLSIDRLVAPRFRAVARELLSTVSEAHSWGIPRAARPRWSVFFKGGWRPDGDGSIVHQGALLEAGSERLAIAVLSDGNHDETYGHETAHGVARILLEPLTAGAIASPKGAGASGRLRPLGELAGARPNAPAQLQPISG
jgi:hypothetical protein